MANRLAAGEDWQSPGIHSLLETALHEIGLLPKDADEAGLMLMREVAHRILTNRISESLGMAAIWGVLNRVPELRREAPFDEITATQEKMDRYWPYHEEENKRLVRNYATAVINIQQPTLNTQRPRGEPSLIVLALSCSPIRRSRLRQERR